MNTTVEKWLQAQKEAQSASEKAKREKHLIGIGLIDENKSRYTDVYGNTLTKEKYDSIIANGYALSVKKTEAALDVTDEEYAEICKYAPENKTDIDEQAEIGLVKVANAVKIIGVILWIIWTLIGLFGGLAVAESMWEFSVGLFMAYFFGGVFSGFICWLGCYLLWSVLKVFANISRTLYKIEAKRE